MSSGQWSLLAAVCGALITGGLLLVVRGAMKVPQPLTRPPSPWAQRGRRLKESMPQEWVPRYRLVVGAAALAMVGAWLYTGRPVHGLLAAAAVLGLPWIWNPAGTAERQAVRLEALAEWLQQLAGVHQGGSTLTAAIEASAPRAPAPIRAEVRTLAARLRMGVPPQIAYRQFADQLADGASDNVVLLFLTHTKDHGRGLSKALQSMSEFTSTEARTLRTVDAERNKTRTSTRWVSIVAIILAVYIVSNPSWSGVYRTATGQLVLLAFGIGFAASLLLLRRLAVTRPDPRLQDPLPPVAELASASRSSLARTQKGARL